MQKKVIIVLLSSLFILLATGCSQGTNNIGSKEVQTVNIVADEWSFTPNNLEVNAGKIKLIIENKGKRVHGIRIKELNFKEEISPGQTVEMVLEINQPGTYEFECSILCGPLEEHKAMKGKLIVK